MDTRSRTTATAVLALALTGLSPLAAEAQAERWSIEGRIGATLPTGDLTEGPGSQTAGLAFAADLMYTLNTNFTLYGGFGHHRFNCDGCNSDISTTGLDAGAKFLFGSNEDAMPWVRGGLIVHKPEVEGLDGEWNLGLDTGVGIDWRVSHAVTLVPALRFNTYDGDGATFSWFTIDLGAHFHIGG